MARGTSRHGDARRGACRDHRSSRSGATSGIVTSTSSGRAHVEQRRGLVEPAEHLDAVDAAPPHARVVVDEADDALVGRLAQLAREPAARSGRRRRSAPARAAAGAAPHEVGQPSAAPAATRRRARAEQRVDEEDLEREVAEVRVCATIASAIGAGERRSPRRSRARSRGARIAPDAAVDAERDEEHVAERRAAPAARRGRPPAATSVPCRRRRAIRGEERAADDGEVDEHLDEPPRLRDERPEERRRLARLGPRASAPRGRRGSSRTGRARRTMTSTPKTVTRRVVEHVVGEAGQRRAGRHQRKQRRPPAAPRARSRRAGATRGRGRPASPAGARRVRRIVTSAVSRIGIASTSSGSTMRRRASPRRPSSSTRARATRARSRSPGCPSRP